MAALERCFCSLAQWLPFFGTAPCPPPLNNDLVSKVECVIGKRRWPELKWRRRNTTWINLGMFFWCSHPLFPHSSSKLSAVISTWVLLATWLRFSLQKCMLAARKTYPLTFSSHFLWKAQVSFSLTVKNVWRGKGTSPLCKTAERSYFHPLHQTFHVALFALCSVPSGKRSGRKSKCKLSRYSWKTCSWAFGVNPLQWVHFSSSQFHEFGHKQKAGFNLLKNIYIFSIC